MKRQEHDATISRAGANIGWLALDAGFRQCRQAMPCRYWPCVDFPNRLQCASRNGVSPFISHFSRAACGSQIPRSTHAKQHSWNDDFRDESRAYASTSHQPQGALNFARRRYCHMICQHHLPMSLPESPRENADIGRKAEIRRPYAFIICQLAVSRLAQSFCAAKLPI